MNLNEFYNDFYSRFLNFTVVDNELFAISQRTMIPQWSYYQTSGHIHSGHLPVLLFCPQQSIKITFHWRLCAGTGIINHVEWTNKQKISETWTLKYWSNRLCVTITQTHRHRLARSHRKADFTVAYPATMMNCKHLFSLLPVFHYAALGNSWGGTGPIRSVRCVYAVWVEIKNVKTH